MICPRCSAEFAQRLGSCPECGVHLLRNVSGLVKTSAVLISSGADHEFYRSVQDVPEALRARLIEVTNSANSGTIVIADRAGKEQIGLGMARRDTLQEQSPPPTTLADRLCWLWSPAFLPWAAAFLLLTAAAVLAAAFLAR